MNDAEWETWLLEYEGSQFIFVPGRKMSLWDGIQAVSSGGWCIRGPEEGIFFWNF